MRRFNYEDNEEHREDVDKFFSESNMSEQDWQNLNDLAADELAQHEMQIRLANQDSNIRLLRMAQRICETSVWWAYMSHKKRMDMLVDTYETLKLASNEEI
jgi:hypothetical protein